MTVAESLARKMADRRKTELNTEREVAVEALKAFDPKSASAYDKALAKKTRAARNQASVLGAELNARGYEVDERGTVTKYLKDRGWNHKTPEERAIAKAFDDRLTKMWRLAEKANVELHGLKPTQAKPVLEQLRVDLDGV